MTEVGRRILQAVSHMADEMYPAKGGMDHLSRILSEEEDDEGFDAMLCAFLEGVFTQREGRAAQHYILDVSEYHKAGDGSQAADCWRNRHGLWVVDGNVTDRHFTAWIDVKYGGE